MTTDRINHVDAPLTLRNVSKRFGSVEALNTIALRVEGGSSVGLIGMNGAGKSTLFNVILDLVSLDEGSIEIFGIDHRTTGARANIAYLPENFRAPYYATGADVLRYVSALHGRRLDHDMMRTECQNLDFPATALARVTREYSTGMMRKLGLIACLLAKSPMLILDEPMSGLDPHARALFKARLNRLSDAGTTIIFTTHLVEDIAQMATELAVLHAGCLQYHGSIDGFREKYPAKSLENAFLESIGVSAAA